MGDQERHTDHAPSIRAIGTAILGQQGHRARRVLGPLACLRRVPGLVETLGMPPTTIYRKVKSFRVVFWIHPDEFEFHGLSLDLKKWHNQTDDDE